MNYIADIKDFLLEAEENIEKLESTLLNLENDKSNLSLIKEALRYSHSIKGGASFFDLGNIVKLSHELESVFKKISDKEIDLTVELFDAMLQAKDVLENMIADVDNQDEVNIAEVVTKLNIFVLSKDTQRDIKFPDFLLDEAAFNQSVSLGYYIYSYTTKDDYVFLSDYEEIKNVSKMISYKKRYDTYHIYFGSPLEMELLEILLSDLKSNYFAMKKPDFLEISMEYSKGFDTKNETIMTDTIRVNVDTLDNLLNQVGELILVKNQMELFLQHNNDANDVELRKIKNDISRLSNNLHQSVLSTRMRSIDAVFDKFPRLVRSLSRQLNKNINIIIQANDVIADRSIIEKLHDPLTHLIRNAIDHGIELPSERIKMHKNEIATIHLHAKSEEGNVIIEISDDGKGINLDKIRKKAIEKQLYTKSEIDKMTDLEIMNIIFISGFTTIDKVSEISGRGVGLDVVKENIESINGNLDVTTVVDKGTTFTIKLPLTIAIVPGMLFRIGNSRFILQRHNVEEVIYLQDENDVFKVDRIKEHYFLFVRESVIPILHLSKIFGIDHQIKNQKFIILKAGLTTFAIEISEIFTIEDVLVKSLPKIFHTKFYDTAAISSDGEIVPILDVNAIGNLIDLSSVDKPKARIKKANIKVQTAQYITVDVNDQSHYVIPTKYIKRILNFSRNDVKRIKGEYYAYMKEKRYKLFDLPTFIDGKTSLSNDIYAIILDDQTNLGFFVNRVRSVIDIEVDCKIKKLEKLGIIGTLTIENSLRTVIDVPYIQNQLQNTNKEVNNDG